MNAKRKARYQWWLRQRLPIVGMIVPRMAAVVLSRIQSSEAAHALAEEICISEDDKFAAFLTVRLGGVMDSDSISEICFVWSKFRHPRLAQFISENQLVPPHPARTRVLSALKVGTTELILAGQEEVVDPLIKACSDIEPEIANRARECLLNLKSSRSIDTLCAQWAETRDQICAETIRQRGFIASAPPRVHVLTLLKNNRGDKIKSIGSECVGPLSQALFDSEPEIREAARMGLANLENVEAQEVFCRLVIEFGLPVYREIVLQTRYAPREVEKRALFLFLTEQWEKYLDLDFDQSLLGIQFENGTPKIRSRIAETARQAGRTEWITAIRGGPQNKRVNELTDEEWDAAVTVMQAGNRWKEMWQLAQVAPADWGCQLLQRLMDASYEPKEPSEVMMFSTLVGLAECCKGEPPFLGRLIRSGVLVGSHAGKVTCLELSRSSRMVATGSDDHTAKLWDLQTAKSPITLRGHEDWILCTAMSPDESVLSTGGADGTVRLWNARSGELRFILHGHTEEVRCMSFSADGYILATGSSDKCVRLWNVNDGVSIKVLAGHIDFVNCLAVSPDGRMLATGSYDNDIRLWNLPDGNLAAVLSGHRAMVNCLAFRPGNDMLISGGKDRSVILWRLPTGKVLRKLKGHRDDISCLAVSSDGGILASGSWDTTIRLWSLTDGELLDTLGRSRTNDGHSSWVTCLAFSPDRDVLASGSADHTVRLWSIPGGAPLRVLDGHRDRVTCVRFSSDARALISGSWDRTILLWKSELARLRRIPIGETTLEDLDWVEKTLSNSRLMDSERRWLEFLQTAIRWRRRYDIQLGDAASISVGEFDIEIGG